MHLDSLLVAWSLTTILKCGNHSDVVLRSIFHQRSQYYVSFIIVLVSFKIRIVLHICLEGICIFPTNFLLKLKHNTATEDSSRHSQNF